MRIGRKTYEHFRSSRWRSFRHSNGRIYYPCGHNSLRRRKMRRKLHLFSENLIRKLREKKTNLPLTHSTPPFPFTMSLSQYSVTSTHFRAGYVPLPCLEEVCSRKDCFIFFCAFQDWKSARRQLCERPSHTDLLGLLCFWLPYFAKD